ncbi:MAG: ROK family protein [Aeromonas sp.]
MSGAKIANIDLIKQVNYAAVYRLIDKMGPISRVEIAKQSELAPASVTKITRQFIDHGLIQETAPQASTGGRRAISLIPITDNFQLVSAKLGRGYLKLALYDLAANMLASSKCAIDVLEEAAVEQAILGAIDRFIWGNSERITQLISIALTMPGLINPQTGVVIYIPHYQIRNYPLSERMRQHFGLPCYVGNDTRALALAEHYCGASQDSLDSVLINVHQGVGAGIITQGKVFLGHNRNVGEIGHIQLDPLGKRCHCGNFGCLETILSNGALLEQVRLHLSEGHTSVLNTDNLSIEGLCQAALEGDKLARRVLGRAGEYLGRAIGIMVNLFNPQKVLLAGEITAATHILLPAIRRCVAHQSLPAFHQELPIIPASFQQQTTMGGFALVKRALREEDLLLQIMAASGPLSPLEAP